MNNKEKFAKILDEVYKEAERNRDFELGVNQLRMDDEGRIGSIDKLDRRGSLLSDFATTQLFTKLDMPVRYMKKLANESPEMVARQFNFWAGKQEEDKKLLLRGQKLDGDFMVRGVLSDRYTIMDNKDVLESLIEVAETVPDFDMVSVVHNDKKLHMRLAFPDLSEDFGISAEGKKDIIRVGLDIQNSEIGYSSLMVAPITYRLVCTNGMKMWKKEEGAFKQRHVHMEASELRDLMKVTMKNSVDKGKELIEGMKESQKVRVETPFTYIENMGKKHNLSNKMIERIKDNYRIEPEGNLFSVVNSFTRTARDLTNHDARLNMESIASELMFERQVLA